eukprot:gene14160-15639_t
MPRPIASPSHPHHPRLQKLLAYFKGDQQLLMQAIKAHAKKLMGNINNGEKSEEKLNSEKLTGLGGSEGALEGPKGQPVHAMIETTSHGGHQYNSFANRLIIMLTRGLHRVETEIKILNITRPHFPENKPEKTKEKKLPSNGQETRAERWKLRMNQLYKTKFTLLKQIQAVLSRMARGMTLQNALRREGVVQHDDITEKLLEEEGESISDVSKKQGMSSNVDIPMRRLRAVEKSIDELMKNVPKMDREPRANDTDEDRKLLDGEFFRMERWILKISRLTGERNYLVHGISDIKHMLGTDAMVNRIHDGMTHENEAAWQDEAAQSMPVEETLLQHINHDDDAKIQHLMHLAEHHDTPEENAADLADSPELELAKAAEKAAKEKEKKPKTKPRKTPTFLSPSKELLDELRLAVKEKDRAKHVKGHNYHSMLNKEILAELGDELAMLKPVKKPNEFYDDTLVHFGDVGDDEHHRPAILHSDEADRGENIHDNHVDVHDDHDMHNGVHDENHEEHEYHHVQPYEWQESHPSKLPPSDLSMPAGVTHNNAINIYPYRGSSRANDESAHVIDQEHHADDVASSLGNEDRFRDPIEENEKQTNIKNILSGFTDRNIDKDDMDSMMSNLPGIMGQHVGNNELGDIMADMEKSKQKPAAAREMMEEKALMHAKEEEINGPDKEILRTHQDELFADDQGKAKFEMNQGKQTSHYFKPEFNTEEDSRLASITAVEDTAKKPKPIDIYDAGNGKGVESPVASEKANYNPSSEVDAENYAGVTEPDSDKAKGDILNLDGGIDGLEGMDRQDAREDHHRLGGAIIQPIQDDIDDDLSTGQRVVGVHGDTGDNMLAMQAMMHQREFDNAALHGEYNNMYHRKEANIGVGENRVYDSDRMVTRVDGDSAGKHGNLEDAFETMKEMKHQDEFDQNSLRHDDTGQRQNELISTSRGGAASYVDTMQEFTEEQPQLKTLTAESRRVGNEASSMMVGKEAMAKKEPSPLSYIMSQVKKQDAIDQQYDRKYYASSNGNNVNAPLPDAQDTVLNAAVSYDDVSAEKKWLKGKKTTVKKAAREKVAGIKVGGEKIEKKKVGEKKVGEKKMGEKKMGEKKMGEKKMGEKKMGRREKKMGEKKMGEEDGREEDRGEEDGREEDGGEEDGREEDGREEDGGEEDGREEDGREEDGREEDGGEEDGTEENNKRKEGRDSK